MKIFKSFTNRRAEEDSTDIGKFVIGIIVTLILVVLLVTFFTDVFNPGRDILQKTSEESIQKQNESIKGK